MERVFLRSVAVVGRRNASRSSACYAESQHEAIVDDGDRMRFNLEALLNRRFDSLHRMAAEFAPGSQARLRAVGSGELVGVASNSAKGQWPRV
ncbi:MAG: hypothetical protein L0387_33565 [Acidobacteria bacterium]|nr:hypothetical protein [Acidobacteriota bacterium]